MRSAGRSSSSSTCGSARSPSKSRAALAFVVSLVAAAAIFMFVRLRGGNSPSLGGVQLSGGARLVAQGGDEAVCEVPADCLLETLESGLLRSRSAARAETSARIRVEAAGATFVSTAALMERASAPARCAAIPGGSERSVSAVRSCSRCRRASGRTRLLSTG